MTAPRLVVGLAAAAVGALTLAACGGGVGSTDHAAVARPRPTAPAAAASSRAQLAALHQQVTRSLHHASTQRYGGAATYLPRTVPPTHRVLVASAARRVVAVQGDGVALHLASGSARAVVVGPEIATRDQGSFRDTAVVRFDVTLSHVHGRLPIDHSRFTIVDEAGVLHHPHVAVRGRAPVPALATPGRGVTLVLQTTLPIGNGRVRYQPTGSHAVAEWDFDSETD